jgi:hypothetical protein
LKSPLLFVRFDHVASRIVNANHGIMRPAETFSISDGVIGLVVPQLPEWQRIGNQIDAAFIFARTNGLGETFRR